MRRDWKQEKCLFLRFHLIIDGWVLVIAGPWRGEATL